MKKIITIPIAFFSFGYGVACGAALLTEDSYKQNDERNNEEYVPPTTDVTAERWLGLVFGPIASCLLLYA